MGADVRAFFLPKGSGFFDGNFASQQKRVLVAGTSQSGVGSVARRKGQGICTSRRKTVQSQRGLERGLGIARRAYICVCQRGVLGLGGGDDGCMQKGLGIVDLHAGRKLGAREKG